MEDRLGGFGCARALAIGAIALTLGVNADARTFARVTLPSLDRDTAGAPLTLDAILLLPDGPMPAGGFPAIVALHGCSGMYSSLKGRADQLSERLMARADMLLNEGYALVFPDSFGARGFREICTIKSGERSISAVKRKLDALGALAFLAARHDIARDRIALVGWSHGGSAMLAAINARDNDVAAFRDRPGAPPFFRAAVAFYPGCRAALAAGPRWEPAVPARILIGELDDWTPPKPCVDLGASVAAAARGDSLKVTVFPGAHHGFDAPGSTVAHRTDVPNGVNPGQGVHVGANPAMREKANAKLRGFLDEQLRGRLPD
ncbi:MAG: dienelactone hydrolase family protein [Casimicrobiaceae bacterium]